jgi:hypothetical protein
MRRVAGATGGGGVRTKTRLTLAAVVIMAIGALIPMPGAAAGTPILVAAGFDSPRGIDVYQGRLVVGESGHGGRNCIPGTPTLCFGRSSQISVVNTATGNHSPLVDHLFSVAEIRGPGEVESLGVHGLSAQGDKLMAIVGVYPQAFENYSCAAGDTECQADVAAATQQAGALLSVRRSGAWRVITNVGAFDYDFTADIPNQEHDANPYGVLAARGGAYVADAGSNTLNFVSGGGRDTILQYFPFRNDAGFPSDEVPTCVVKTGADLWVGTLAGHLYRVRAGSATLVPDPNLVHVTGCTADRSRNVYFVNMWSTPDFPTPFSGTIVKFDTRSRTSSVIASGIDFPNMDVVGRDGNLYFTADSICPAEGIQGLCPNGGTVWKLALPRQPDESEGDE